MSSKVQTNHDANVASTQQSSKPPVRDSAVITEHTHPATIIRQARFEPGSLTPRDVLQLQRTIGNQAVQHLLQAKAGGLEAPSKTIGGAPTVHQHAPAFSVQRQVADPAKAKAEDAAFGEWWKHVVGYEGSLEDWKKNPANKSDRGGETNWGVTKKLYMARAEAFGLPATEAGFAAMTPAQAMRFGQMIWKGSGANRTKNPGVALVLADWYWGGIQTDRFSALLKEKGRAATFKEGMPDEATIDFLNTLPPDELVNLMSDAKAAQYRQIAEKDPSQQKFLKGWLKRNEERREQAQPFVSPQNSQPAGAQSRSTWERGQRALDQARGVLEMGEATSSEQKKAASDELWAVVGKIEEQQKLGFAHAEEEAEMENLKGQLLKETGRLMGTGS